MELQKLQNIRSQCDGSAEHLYWVDVLRVFAALAVVLIHSGLSRPFLTNGSHDVEAILIATGSLICRPAVIWFLFLTGALLISRDESLGIFFAKRLGKLFKPLIFWSCVYYIFRMYFNNESEITFFKWEWITEGVFYHMWFLHALCVIYLVLPFLRRFAQDKYLLLLFLIGWTFVAYIYPVADQVFGDKPADFSYNDNYLIGYIGYPVLGFVLISYFPKIKFRYLATSWLLATSVLLVAIICSILSFNLIYSYRSPVILLYAIIGYLSFNQIPTILNLECCRSILNFIAPCTFGIYLLHPLILRLISVVPETFIYGEIIGILIRGILAFFISAACVHWIRKTKLGRLVCP